MNSFSNPFYDAVLTAGLPGGSPLSGRGMRQPPLLKAASPSASRAQAPSPLASVLRTSATELPEGSAGCSRPEQLAEAASGSGVDAAGPQAVVSAAAGSTLPHVPGRGDMAATQQAQSAPLQQGSSAVSPSLVVVELLAASRSSTAATCVDLLEELSAELVAQTSADIAGLQELPASAAADKAAGNAAYDAAALAEPAERSTLAPAGVLPGAAAASDAASGQSAAEQVGTAAMSPISTANMLTELEAVAEHVAHFDGLIASMASRADSFRFVAAEQQLALANVQAVTATAEAAMAANWVADTEVGD